MGILSRGEVRYVLRVVILFGVYLATAKVGLSLAPVNTFASLIWPPTGIALAALLLYGYRLTPAVLLGAFIANLLSGASPPIAGAIALGNTLEALVGVYLLRAVGFENSFGRLRDALAFITLAALLATTISASVGIGALAMGGFLPFAEISPTWVTWWVGDVLGALVFAPLLLIWFSSERLRFERRKTIEVALLFTTLVGLNVLAFWGPWTYLGNFPLIYLLPVPLIWSTLRFGPRGKSMAIFATAAISTAATISGYGPFAQLGIVEGLFISQTFVGAISIIFLLFASVVEERKRAIASLQDYIERLESAVQKISSEDQAKTDFLAILAHELRNPLAPVISSIELMKANGIKQENAPLFNIIDDQIKNVVRLLDDLLDISRISRKKIKIRKETVDLRTAMNQSLQTVEPLLKAKRHTLALLAPQEPLWVDADTLRLEQILVNLLNNAVKYTDQGGHITFCAAREGNQVRVAVRDSGMGIEPAMLPKIFEPFLQLPTHEPMRRKEGGLGIGLSLTKRLVELHGGSIAAFSKGPGEGSEFSVRLPAPQEVQLSMLERLKAAEAAPLRSERPPSRRKILVVDDNELAADGLAKLLELKGHETRVAYSGKSAIEAFLAYQPEAVILDLGLPDQSGFDVARRMQEEDSSIALIALTGYGQSEDRLKTQNAGFAHHLVKPVGIADVEKALASV